MATAKEEMEQLLKLMQERQASDLHLLAGEKPMFRTNTAIEDATLEPLNNEQIQWLLYSIMLPKYVEHFEQTNASDFAYNLEGVSRFRINVYRERGNVAAAIRRVNTKIPSWQELHLPEAVEKVTHFDQGLVMVSGPTSSGKSTTLTSLLDLMNQTQRLHILTIEDPIEYLLQNKRAIISQREVGIDVESFPAALKDMVRQDPDVIFIGEMRDMESFDAALAAAQTGHLVFSTIHAGSATQTIERLIELFPHERQPLVRQAVAFNLRAVLCQKLLPSIKESVKMVPAVEILFNNAVVQQLIQANEDSKIPEVIRGSVEEGMQDFNQALLKLINAKTINKQTAILNSPQPAQLKMNLQGIFTDEGRRILG